MEDLFTGKEFSDVEGGILHGRMNAHNTFESP